MVQPLPDSTRVEEVLAPLCDAGQGMSIVGNLAPTVCTTRSRLVIRRSISGRVVGQQEVEVARELGQLRQGLIEHERVVA